MSNRIAPRIAPRSALGGATLPAVLAGAALALVAIAPLQAQAKPDLTVSAIATPGGLCAGNEGKVRVNISNSQMAGVSQKIPVILFVSQPPHQPSSYVGYLEKGIGPRTSAGQPVWFNDVVVPDLGNVTLRAVVNPDQEIEESRYNNNDKVQTAKVVKHCGQAPAPAPGASLTVTTFHEGTWQAGNYQAIAGANVSVTCGSFSATGQTGSDGKATFASVPKGSCSAISAAKTGCTTKSQGYMMPTYNANVNLGLTCQ